MGSLLSFCSNFAQFLLSFCSDFAQFSVSTQFSVLAQLLLSSKFSLDSQFLLSFCSNFAQFLLSFYSVLSFALVLAQLLLSSKFSLNSQFCSVPTQLNKKIYAFEFPVKMAFCAFVCNCGSMPTLKGKENSPPEGRCKVRERRVISK